jgi:hypothetical protein
VVVIAEIIASDAVTAAGSIKAGSRSSTVFSSIETNSPRAAVLSSLTSPSPFPASAVAMAVIATSAEARAAELAAAFSAFEVLESEAVEGAIELNSAVASAIMLSALVQLPGPMFVLKLPVGQAVHSDSALMIAPTKFGAQPQSCTASEPGPSVWEPSVHGSHAWLPCTALNV